MTKKITKLFIALALFTTAGTASAQLSAGSVFLKGKFVEAGICANGDFGAPSPPAGYHPHTTSAGGSLGFVADPAMDGWTTGSPAYTGDFFTPGFPYEAFNVQIGTLTAQSQSCMGFSGSGTLTGTNTGYAVSGSKVIATWEGILDSVTIKQETTLDTLDLYFSIRITMTNTASIAKNDIYYLRSVDADNDQSWGGSFATKNKIEYQLPNAANASVVSARGTLDTNSYLSLGTTDSNAKCFVYASLAVVDTLDISTVFSGTYPTTLSTAGATNIADQGMGLAFYINHLAPLDSASDSVAYKPTNAAAHHLHPANQRTFTYFYAFSRPAVDSAIKELVDTMTHTPVVPNAVNNINDQKTVHVYPNPSHDVFNITNLETGDLVTIFDLMGKDISQMQATSNTNVISVKDIPAGTYVMQIKDAGGHLKARIPVKKQ